MAGHPQNPARTYIASFFALGALMALTMGAYYLDLGQAALPVALLIATCKAALIILIFMNVWFEKQLTKIFAAAGFFWFLILIFFIMADFVFPYLGSPIVQP